MGPGTHAATWRQTLGADLWHYVKIPNEAFPNVKIPNRDWQHNPEHKNPEFWEAALPVP